MKECPKCSSKDSVVPIRYGMPSVEMQNEYDEGKIRIGGCVIEESAPDYHCNYCQYEWEKGKPSDGFYAESDEED